MTFTDAALRAALPGLPAAFEASELRLAAVLLPVFQRDGADHLLFTVRRADLRQHAGQIAFPGGMRQGDESPADTARRETSEEIGLDAAAIQCLGGLPPRRSSSAILVHAVVGRIRDPRGCRVDPGEVERLLAVPLEHLRDESRWQLLPSPQALASQSLAAQSPPSPHFAVGGDTIWGLTGRFAFDLVQALRGR
jgi:8-oxo-dGTP pyrophosphatase MutT (NUDIX family)